MEPVSLRGRRVRGTNMQRLKVQQRAHSSAGSLHWAAWLAAACGSSGCCLGCSSASRASPACLPACPLARLLRPRRRPGGRGFPFSSGSVAGAPRLLGRLPGADDPLGAFCGDGLTQNGSYHGGASRRHRLTCLGASLPAQSSAAAASQASSTYEQSGRLRAHHGAIATATAGVRGKSVRQSPSPGRASSPPAIGHWGASSSALLVPAPWPHRAPGGPTTPTGLRQGPATEATRTGIGWGLYQLMPASPPLAIADEREPHLAWLGSSADFR